MPRLRVSSRSAGRASARRQFGDSLARGCPFAKRSFRFRVQPASSAYTCCTGVSPMPHGCATQDCQASESGPDVWLGMESPCQNLLPRERAPSRPGPDCAEPTSAARALAYAMKRLIRAATSARSS